ncbi:MAG: divergent polysaccharide deacetylase family protein [Proteobacteria bacterium]|nr:divergent polysaccharide deacetylase family protein [Pseudomonadota bacterium]
MIFFKRFKRFPFLTVIIVAAVIAAVFIYLERVVPRTDQTAVHEGRTAVPREKALQPLPPERKGAGVESGGRQIAIIIDDIGYDLRLVEELIRIEAPIAFAILPHTPHAREAARRLHAAGKEILLHLPMEPRSYPEENPGKGALFVDMDEGEIRRRIETDLTAVPYVSGVNNHMGSRFMEDEAGLAVVMEELAKKGLYFVDSVTTPDSRARSAAARAGVRYAARSVFIDHTPHHAAVLANLQPPRRGREQGKPLLMIGHPRPETMRALREAQPLWQREGVRMIPLSAYLAVQGRQGKDDILVKNR